MNNTRLICFAVATFALFLIRPSHAQAGEGQNLSFFKVGNTYRIVHGFEASLPNEVKVLEAAGGGWFRVEYIHRERVRIPRESERQNVPMPVPTITKEMWINLAQVAGVTEVKK